MAVKHYLKPGITDRSRVKILTVDTARRRVEAAFKDGSMIQIAVWDTPHAFRWPKENEIWLVRRDNGIWMLDCKQDGQVSGSGTSVQVAPEPHPVEAMNPGEMKLDSDVIVTASGSRVASLAVARYSLTSTGALTLDAATGNVQVVTLTANATSSTIANPNPGQVLTVQWLQGAGGSHTYAWPSSCKFAGGAAPSASTTAGYTDAVSFCYDGAAWKEISRALAIR